VVVLDWHGNRCGVQHKTVTTTTVGGTRSVPPVLAMDTSSVTVAAAAVADVMDGRGRESAESEAIPGGVGIDVKTAGTAFPEGRRRRQRQRGGEDAIATEAANDAADVGACSKGADGGWEGASSSKLSHIRYQRNVGWKIRCGGMLVVLAVAVAASSLYHAGAA
jgi:hypothetical protein